MSRYLGAFDYLAERDDPVGVAELMRRVQHELDTPAAAVSQAQLSDTSLPRLRRPGVRGPAVALLVFAVVMAIGAGLWLLRSGTVEPAHPTDIDTMPWRRLPAGVPGYVTVAGPGGFVAVGVGSPSYVQYSTDGVDWQFQTMPAFPELALARDLVATDTSWLLIGQPSDRVSGWVSPNGRDWVAVELPERLASSYAFVVADSGRFLATVEDPFDESPFVMWRSQDGVTWDETTPVGLPDRGWAIAGGSVGFVAWRNALEPGAPTETYFSRDGESWTAGSFPRPESAEERNLISDTVQIGGLWLATGFQLTQGGDPQIAVWASKDGLHWGEQPSPPFGLDPFTMSDPDPFPLRGILSTDDTLIVISGRAAWATSDGTAWRIIHTFDADEFGGGAVGYIEGQPVAVWKHVDLAGDLIVTTTIALQVDLEQAGIELQDQILADETVTRAEFEEAVAGMAACMDARGVTVEEWSVDDDGGWTMAFGGPDSEAVENLCFFSYVDRVSTRLGR